MIDLIQNYLNGETKDFYGLVGRALHASNGMPPTLVDGGILAWVIHDKNLEGLIREIISWMAAHK